MFAHTLSRLVTVGVVSSYPNPVCLNSWVHFFFRCFLGLLCLWITFLEGKVFLVCMFRVFVIDTQTIAKIPCSIFPFSCSSNIIYINFVQYREATFYHLLPEFQVPFNTNIPVQPYVNIEIICFNKMSTWIILLIYCYRLYNQYSSWNYFIQFELN